MMNKTMIPVVYASDNNYARYMLVSMYSMLDNLRKDCGCEFHLLVSADFSEKNKEMLRDRLSAFDNFTLDYIYMDNRFDELVNPVERLSSATLFRLCLADLLPEIGRCIYIDCDTLVAGDISRLWNEATGDAIVGGVQAHNFTMEEKRHRKRLMWDRDLPFMYVNAGVLLLDLEAMRRENVVPALLSEVDKGYYYSDQDIINKTCAGRVAYVHPRYNIRPYYSGWISEVPEDSADAPAIEEALSDPVVYHFATTYKPWKDTGMHYADTWLSYALNDDLANLFDDVKGIMSDPEMTKYIALARENSVKYLRLRKEARLLKKQLKALEKENMGLKADNEKLTKEKSALEKELKKIKAGRAYKIASSLGKLVK